MEDKILTIEKVVFGGKGLSRDLQKVTLIPFVLPGEKVRARVTKEHPDYYEAEPVEIVERSLDRVTPQCPYFGRCGGCQISHATYSRQLVIKKEILEETLNRNKIQFPTIETFADQPFQYRHRAGLKFDAGNHRLGFFEKNSHVVTDIVECLCLTPGLNRLLSLLRKRLLLQPVAGLRDVECFEDDQGRTAIWTNVPLPATLQKDFKGIQFLDEATQPALKVAFRGYKFPIGHNIFLQVNPRMWKTMIEEVEGHHENSTDETALELYAGAGFFTAPLAAKFQRIIACEENDRAIDYAKLNHGLSNVEWHCDRAERFSFPAKARVLIADPPRAGFTKRVLEKILLQNLKRITYVSCNCSSFARDMKGLSSKFRIQNLSLLDLFPQTFHFETIALLVARSD